MKIILRLLFVALSFSIGLNLSADDIFSFSRFPMGVFSSDPHRDEQLEELKAAGFDMIHSYATTDERYEIILSQAEKHGMKVMFNLNRRLVTEEGGLEKMRATVRRYKDHPALGFWYLYDEPAREITPAVIKPFYEMLREEAPNIKVAIVNCWDETWYKYSNVLDIQMIDIYPVRDQPFPDTNIQTTTKFTAGAVKLGKPVMFVPQLCCYKSFPKLAEKYDPQGLRFPNEAEMRYMTYGPMTYGLCGLFPYSFYHAIRTGGDKTWFGKVAAPLFREIRAFTDLAEKPSKPVIFARPNDGNYLAAYWKTGEDEGLLVFINSWPMARDKAGAWLDGYFKQDYELTAWGQTRPNQAAMTNSRINLENGMEPWETTVWKITKKQGAE